jgi:hypothetical protein
MKPEKPPRERDTRCVEFEISGKHGSYGRPQRWASQQVETCLFTRLATHPASACALAVSAFLEVLTAAFRQDDRRARLYLEYEAPDYLLVYS